MFYTFDAPVLAGEDLRGKPLASRREMLRDLISNLPETIRFSETFGASASDLMAAVRPMDSSAFVTGCSAFPNLSWPSRSALAVVYDRVPVEGLGAADAIGSILKGISNVTDCGILQI